MCVLTVITFSRQGINRARLPILLVVSWTGRIECFSVLVHALGFGLARRVRPPRTASSCTCSTLRLNLVLTRKIPPAFRGSVHFITSPTAIGSVPSLSGHAIAYRRLSLPRVRRQRASILKVVPVTGAAFSGITMDQLMCASLSPHPL